MVFSRQLIDRCFYLLVCGVSIRTVRSDRIDILEPFVCDSIDSTQIKQLNYNARSDPNAKLSALRVISASTPSTSSSTAPRSLRSYCIVPRDWRANDDMDDLNNDDDVDDVDGDSRDDERSTTTTVALFVSRDARAWSERSLRAVALLAPHAAPVRILVTNEYVLSLSLSLS